MYTYNSVDQQIVDQRVQEFQLQTQQFLAGEMAEDVFRPLRLQNGLYIQRHAPMLRVAIPYGVLSSKQLRMLAQIADRYDRGYGHFTTRQNMQFNWIQLAEVPDILRDLATVQMHAIQTSGNCIRNVTIDPLTDISSDSEVDVRPYAELLRQWSTDHPEFLYLPRKFKIAINGAREDRAAILAHDIGLQLRIENKKTVVDIFCGGGLGRTPIIGKQVFTSIPEPQILAYLEAILRVYNEAGRRDNKYKARIKILLKALGVEAFREKVTNELNRLEIEYETKSWLTDIKNRITKLKFHADNMPDYSIDKEEARWRRRNTQTHVEANYSIVFIPLKDFGEVPGDISSDKMRALADLADQYSFGQIRSTHRQNLVFPHVAKSELSNLYQSLKKLSLVRPNYNLASDMICCPGFDFCSLANAEAIGVAKAIDKRLSEDNNDEAPLSINLSGCMNACGHHHIAGIGLLGVDKDGEDWYQITLGGSSIKDAHIGRIIGRSIAKEQVPEAVNKIVTVFQALRSAEESMPELIDRVGLKPFKEAVYG